MPFDAGVFYSTGPPLGGSLAQKFKQFELGLTEAYATGGGTDVVANPPGTPTPILTKISIDGTAYQITGMGGGGVTTFQALTDTPPALGSAGQVATVNAAGDALAFTTPFGGSYGDLTNPPTLFSGSYADLTNKPTIPTIPDPTTVGHVLTATGTMAGNWDWAAQTGGGGTTVAANPSGTDGVDLYRRDINGTNFNVAIPPSWT